MNRFKDILNKVGAVLKRNILGIWIIMTAWLIFFSPLLAGQIYFLDDLKIIFYPLEHAYGEFQRAWELPQWSTLFGFGQPLLGWGQLGFFTPVHMILRLFHIDALNILQLSIGIYFLLGSLGFYSLLRVRKFSVLASTLGACLFTFTGFHIGHLNHVNFYTSSLLLPYLLLCSHYLIKKPTIYRGALLTLTAAAVAVSGQPQIILYTLLIALIISIGYFMEQYREVFYRAHWFKKGTWIKPLQVLGLTVVAGILSFGMASLSILPLYEFLPQTERAATIPTFELLDFSYPPYHAITLILPYFFGDHSSYWGAKGFQELAAFTGIIPLFLAGAALVMWKRFKVERITGIVLVVIGIVMALGKYSFLYKYLVETHVITSLNIPGRFVFFFLIGLTFLAVCAISDIEKISEESPKKRILFNVLGLAFVVLIFTPFFFYIQYTGRAFEQFNYLLTHPGSQLLPTILGLVAIILFTLTSWYKKNNVVAQYVFVLLSISTLLIFAFNYNPRTSRDFASSFTSIDDYFTNYDQEHAFPGRLYSHPVLIRDIPDQSIHRTDTLSPFFSVYQPVQIDYDNLTCFTIAFKTQNTLVGDIQISLAETLFGEPIREVTLPVSEIRSSSPQQICFDPVPDSAHKIYFLSFTSKYASGITLYYQASENTQLQTYFVRKNNPTPLQLEQSRKNSRIQAEPFYANGTDAETALLSRHLQVIENLSSARWIGALSIRPYREFIESFFANDSEPIDGDGLHAIQRYARAVNMAGITHMIQSLPVGSIDGMENAGYKLVEELPNSSGKIRLYENPNAYPKAYIVPNGVFVAASDETRYLMKDPTMDFHQTVFISGPTPPQTIPPVSSEPLNATADITKYESTRVDVTVTTPREAFLVVNDSTTDQWKTYIDDKQAPQYTGNSVFKTAQVPAGTHTVSFRYESKAIRIGKIVSSVSLIIVFLLLLTPTLIKKIRTYSTKKTVSV